MSNNIHLAQTSLHFTIILSFGSALFSIIGASYIFITKRMSNPINALAITILNLVLFLNLIIQSVVMITITMLLGTFYTGKSALPHFSFDNTPFLSLGIKVFGWAPNLALDFFGAILICLALLVGSIVVLVIDTRLKFATTTLFFYFHIFVLIVETMVTVQDIYVLFIAYELLLIPSFLFILLAGYTNKSIQAAVYFVIWTQIGSFLVLGGIVYLVSITGSSDFLVIRNFKLKTDEAKILYALFFFGFGIKIPIWPFHYWLTKIHVEAPSGFSIYLSGFLVKAALYGFFKITNTMCCEVDTTIFVVIAAAGVLDASAKLWGQSDVKKLVAYCTVQEMNIILVLFLFGDTESIVCGTVFSVAHAFLSALMFFIVDCVYRRSHSRVIYAVQGLLQLTPNLATVIIGMCFLYAGLPGTLKFTCEIAMLILLSESGFNLIFVLLIVTNFIAVAGFSKNWFNIVFTLPDEYMTMPMLDLSWKEIGVIVYIISLFFLTNGLAFLSF